MADSNHSEYTHFSIQTNILYVLLLGRTIESQQNMSLAIMICMNMCIIAYLLFFIVCRRASVPAGHSKNPDYLNLQIKSATMQNPPKSQRDSEYINIDRPVEPTVDSYANFQPICLSAAKHSHEPATEYVNLQFTESDGEHKTTTPDMEPTTSMPVDNASLKLERPALGNGHIIPDEVDGTTSTMTYESKNNTPKILPSAEQTMQTELDVEYENLPTKTPSTTSDPSEYVMLSMVSVSQVSHPQTNPLAAKAYKEIVSIKSPPPTVTMDVSQHDPGRGYEDFVPVQTSSTAGSSLSTEVTTVNTKPTEACKEFVPIMTPPTGDVALPSGTTTEPAGQYEDFVPVKSPTELPSEKSTINQYPQAAAYKEFVPIKTPPSTAQTSLPSSEITSEPARGYEDFVPIKTPPSTHTTDTNISERHSTMEELNSHEIDEEYSRLQFRGKEELTVSEQNNSTTYSKLVHSASTGSSTTSDSFYSKLNVSEVSKTRHASLKDKPQVPSRNLKKPMKLYEASNFVTAVIPPLPPRNRTVQATDSSSSPPPAGPKPKSVTPPLSPPIGPKPVSRFPPEMKYCDIEFTDIGQPKFRPRSKQLTDQSLSHDAYAVIDRDASIGLQLALEQKRHDRR